MADDDFDIDIYGDADLDPTPPPVAAAAKEGKTAPVADTVATSATNGEEPKAVTPVIGNHSEKTEPETAPLDEVVDDRQQIQTTNDSNHSVADIPKQPPQPQGTKRKEGSDERIIEPGATSALLITELQWWHTDDDVRGWVNQAGCEDELIDVTFSEHKVNGKSKGQVYVDFSSQQAATAVKQKIESLSEGQLYVKKPVVKYTDAEHNPFKTIPKDIAPKTAGSSVTQSSGRGGFENRGNSFRGRGNFQNNMNRGNSNNNGYRGNFNVGMNNRGGYQGQMTGFTSNNGMIGQNFGGYNNNMMNMRGGMNAMRGRGGMNPGMMGMPMGGMAMGMGMPMGMNNMAMPGVGFPQMSQQYNPAFFQQQQQQQQQNQMQNQSNGQAQSQSTAKRPRTE